MLFRVTSTHKALNPRDPAVSAANESSVWLSTDNGTARIHVNVSVELDLLQLRSEAT